MIRKYKGFLARNADGSLLFHQQKPHKKDNGWWVNPKQRFYVPRDYFSEITKDLNEPTEVKITIELEL